MLIYNFETIIIQEKTRKLGLNATVKIEIIDSPERLGLEHVNYNDTRLIVSNNCIKDPNYWGMYPTTEGSYVSLTFTETKIWVVSYINPYNGNMRIFINDEFKGSFNTYSNTRSEHHNI